MSSNLATATVNFTLANGLGIYQGASWSIPITITDRDEDGIETPINLTGYTGRCSIKEEANYDLPLLQPDVVMVSPENGQLTLELSDEDTELSQITGKTYDDVRVLQYDVFLDTEEGDSMRILQGYVEVSPSVTKEGE